jgi:tRNA(adenine34) deaminase
MENERFIKAALKQAAVAAKKGEVPVGAVVVLDGRVVARAHNQRESKADPTAHAEMIALRRAANRLGGWRLGGCTLYVTLEPCPMCAGAMINARLDAVVFGAYDPKAGCCGTLYDLGSDSRFNHRVKVTGGVMEAACAKMLSDFFRDRRGKPTDGE